MNNRATKSGYNAGKVGSIHASDGSYHGHDWPRDDVADEVAEERLAAEVLVMFFSKLLAWGEQLQSSKGKPLSLESADDVSHQAPLDAIWLDLQCLSTTQSLSMMQEWSDSVS